MLKGNKLLVLVPNRTQIYYLFARSHSRVHIFYLMNSFAEAEVQHNSHTLMNAGMKLYDRDFLFLHYYHPPIERPIVNPRLASGLIILAARDSYVILIIKHADTPKLNQQHSLSHRHLTKTFHN